MDQKFAVDWCEDLVKEFLPGSDEFFVEVRRLTSKERRHRSSIGAKFLIGKADSKLEEDSIEMSMALDAVKEYEYERCITDFCLPDSRGQKLHHKGNRDDRKVYDHFGKAIEDFVDDLIDRVNKDGKEDEKVTEEAVGNSESSSLSVSEASNETQ